MSVTQIIGLDPGLNRTGWGVIDCEGNRIRHVGHGVITSQAADPMAARLAALHDGLKNVIATWTPDEAAVEEVFVNRNPGSTLKLGMARGIALLVPALAGLPVGEYAANLVKKSVVGAGHADKDQVAMMVGMSAAGCEGDGRRRRRAGGSLSARPSPDGARRAKCRPVLAAVR